MVARPWSDRENDLIVSDYFAMLQEELSGRPYSKTEHRRRLLPMRDSRTFRCDQLHVLEPAAWRGVDILLKGRALLTFKSTEQVYALREVLFYVLREVLFVNDQLRG